MLLWPSHDSAALMNSLADHSPESGDSKRRKSSTNSPMVKLMSISPSPKASIASSSRSADHPF